MLAVKSMDVRDNFKSLCDMVFNGETLIISRPKNENIVMLSEHEYKSQEKFRLSCYDRSIHVGSQSRWIYYEDNFRFGKLRVKEIL